MFAVVWQWMAINRGEENESIEDSWWKGSGFVDGFSVAGSESRRFWGSSDLNREGKGKPT